MSSSETTSVSQNKHSLNERKEDNYRRDSFEDRFCDDLCEEILQYLSLEDKLRLECVSKQFQRTVFQRQYELYINVLGEVEHKRYLKNKFNKMYRNYYYIGNKSMQPFKAVPKKCSNITSIELNRYHYSDGQKINQVFQLIIENCNNLSSVIIDVKNDINDSNLQEFQRKFAQKIKCLRFDRQPIDLNIFPNIEKLSISYVHDIERVDTQRY